ncbi:enoyl-CoA hydratase/isomerase family protein [Chloroflexota bacterium]
MPIGYEKEGHVAIFTIDRPEVMNALSPQALGEWTEALIDFREDKSLWVGIITGAGEKAFCTGLDLRGGGGPPPGGPPPGQGGGAPPPRPAMPTETLVRGLEMWKPLIAAINGYALGGGLEIALACDIRIAADTARLGLTEVTLGLMPGWGGTQRLPRIVSLGTAMEMTLMGRRVDAEEALKIGLVHEVVPQAELMTRAKERAQKMCESAPLAMQGVKEAILRGYDTTLAEGLKIEGEINRSKVSSSNDFREGRKAFQEKRKPDYKGE